MFFGFPIIHPKQTTISTAVFAQRRRMTDRLTDRHTTLRNSPWPVMHSLRPKMDGSKSLHLTTVLRTARPILRRHPNFLQSLVSPSSSVFMSCNIAIRKRERKFLNKFSIIHNALCRVFVVTAKTELESCSQSHLTNLFCFDFV